jgi:hypothetical protein
MRISAPSAAACAPDQAGSPFHSPWADLGGFACGLAPAFLFLPGRADERWAPAKRLAAQLRPRRRSPRSSPACSEATPSETAAAVASSAAPFSRPSSAAMLPQPMLPNQAAPSRRASPASSSAGASAEVALTSRGSKRRLTDPGGAKSGASEATADAMHEDSIPAHHSSYLSAASARMDGAASVERMEAGLARRSLPRRPGHHSTHASADSELSSLGSPTGAGAERAAARQLLPGVEARLLQL